MNRLLPAIVLLFAPFAVFSQARMVINGASAVTIVESGGTSAKPIYIEVANSNPNAITTTGGSNGWIISESEFNMVKWDIGTTTGSYTVPFGYGTANYLPLTTQIGGLALGSGSILFSTYHTIADQFTGVTSTTGDPSDVTNMGPSNLPGSPSNTDNSYNAVDRFWIIDANKFSYLLKPTLSSITFNYIHSGANAEFAAPNNAADESDLIAQRFNTTLNTWGDWLGSGTWSSSGSTGTEANTNSVSALNFYRSWTLSNSINPLPIQLSSFTAQCDNDSVLVQWTSQTELNNDYYTIEKTSDNIHYEIVGTVKGAGTTSLPTNYSLIDHSPFAGHSYYVLSQTDFDGNSSTPPGSTIEFTGCGSDIATTVNAYNTTTNIEVNINAVKADHFTISLTNMLGQTMFSEVRAVALGNNEISLPNNVTPGVYVLNVRNEEVNHAQKMLIGVIGR